jgi:hypothetical protein
MDKSEHDTYLPTADSSDEQYHDQYRPRRLQHKWYRPPRMTCTGQSRSGCYLSTSRRYRLWLAWYIPMLKPALVKLFFHLFVAFFPLAPIVLLLCDGLKKVRAYQK